MPYESTEDRLNRLFLGWTDEEVIKAMTTVRDSLRRRDGPLRRTWQDIWREYARRTFPENLVCKRCGSDNHTAPIHDEVGAA